MFYQILLAAIIYVNKNITQAQQVCEVMLKQTNLATILQFPLLQEQRLENWFHKVVNTMEHVK